MHRAERPSAVHVCAGHPKVLGCMPPRARDGWAPPCCAVLSAPPMPVSVRGSTSKERLESLCDLKDSFIRSTCW